MAKISITLEDDPITGKVKLTSTPSFSDMMKTRGVTRRGSYPVIRWALHPSWLEGVDELARQLRAMVERGEAFVTQSIPEEGVPIPGDHDDVRNAILREAQLPPREER